MKACNQNPLIDYTLLFLEVGLIKAKKPNIMRFEVLKWQWGEGGWKRRLADEEVLQRLSRMLGTRGEIRRGREKDGGWGVAIWKNKGEMDRTEGRGKGGNQPTGKPFGRCLRSVADSPLLVGCDHDSLHRNLWHRRCTCLLTFTTTSSSLVLSLHHAHTHSSNSAVWCLSAFSMCWVELSDFCRLVKCNHSFLPYSSITAHTNGMPTVQKKKQAYCCVCVSASVRWWALIAVHYGDLDW